MSFLELHACPVSQNILLAQHNHCAPTIFHTLHYLIRNHLPGLKVPGVDLTLVPWLGGVTRGLQPWPQNCFNILSIMMRVGDEHIIFLIFVKEVFREKYLNPWLGKKPHLDGVPHGLYNAHAGHSDDDDDDNSDNYLDIISANICPPYEIY